MSASDARLAAGTRGRALNREACPDEPFFLAITLAALGLLFGTAPAADAASVTSCTTTISDKTIDGDLVVPDGKACELDGVTVTGNVQVGHGQ